MIASNIHHYRDPAAVILGLNELRKIGLTPRGLLFIALDPRGETYISVPDDLDSVTQIRVGDKLSLEPPWEGRYFHLDAIHRLPGDTVLWNGDRRLSDTGSAPEVACGVALWLKGFNAKNVFLGCTPHQPGSWWTIDERSPVIDLHATGLVSAVVAASGILARKIGAPGLFHLSWAQLRNNGPRGEWTEVYRSTVGNILMIERRIPNYSLVLTCERALVELDVSGLPEDVHEVATVVLSPGIGVVGRVDGGSFAVTKGRVEPWGLADVKPAWLVGSTNETVLDLPNALSALGKDQKD